MEDLIENITTAVYETWMENDFPKKYIPKQKITEVIHGIADRFKISGNDYLDLESQITALVSEREECSFKDGFSLGTGLASGRLSMAAQQVSVQSDGE